MARNGTAQTGQLDTLFDTLAVDKRRSRPAELTFSEEEGPEDRRGALEALLRRLLQRGGDLK